MTIRLRSLQWMLLASSVASAALAASTPAAAPVLPFIEDDYKTALAQAKQKHVPIFVEAWAPW
ncbi:MAG TPA: hypothetical protein VGH97_15540 [Thermoanaerobaculia bacterium]